MNNRHKYALAQEITNRVILTQLANRRKSNKHAVDYLREVQSKYPLALKLQCIPENDELWQLENFEKFLEARREILAKELNSFLSQITETDYTVGEVSIEDLIRDGESNELELKSSLRWNYKEGRVDKKMEEVIMKSISAFSNFEGGTLIIGVNDEGNVLGLDRDYASIDGNKDKFEIHIRNLINSNFGKVFSTNNINITFHEIEEGVEICKIDIPKGNKPLFLTVSDNNGQKHEKFYVRSGNSSQELSMSEISEYVSGRF